MFPEAIFQIHPEVTLGIDVVDGEVIINDAMWDSVDDAVAWLIQNEHRDKALLIIDAGWGTDGNHALAIASEYGDLDMVERLLDIVVHPDEGEKFPLRRAMRKRHYDVALCLLNAGANAYWCTDKGMHIAAQYGRYDVVKRLLECGARPGGVCIENVLISAIRSGHDEIVEAFTEIDDAPHSYYERGIAVARKHKRLSIVDTLMKVGVKLNDVNAEEFVSAVEYGDKHLVREFVASGIDVNVGEGEPLRKAVMCDNVDVVNELLDAGADVHAMDDYCLRLAAELGKTTMVALLIDAGADVNAQDNQPLHMAIQNGHENVAEILRAHGAEPRSH